MDDDILKYVQKSKYRQRVLKSLSGKVLMPKEIAKQSDIRTNHVSKVLSELRKKDLIEVLDDSVRKGRLYRLKPDGEEVLKKLEE